MDKMKYTQELHDEWREIINKFTDNGKFPVNGGLIGCLLDEIDRLHFLNRPPEEHYIVLYFKPESPVHVQNWLNKILEKENARLVACDNGYYIFEPVVLLSTGLVEQKSD